MGPGRLGPECFLVPNWTPENFLAANWAPADWAPEIVLAAKCWCSKLGPWNIVGSWMLKSYSKVFSAQIQLYKRMYFMLSGPLLPTDH